MSIAKLAAQAMLSDALLPDHPALNRMSHLELELPLDKVIKYVSVGLPLMLVCMAFAREISLGRKLPSSLCFYLKSTKVHARVFTADICVLCNVIVFCLSLCCCLFIH